MPCRADAVSSFFCIAASDTDDLIVDLRKGYSAFRKSIKGLIPVKRSCGGDSSGVYFPELLEDIISSALLRTAQLIIALDAELDELGFSALEDMLYLLAPDIRVIVIPMDAAAVGICLIFDITIVPIHIGQGSIVV